MRRVQDLMRRPFPVRAKHLDTEMSLGNNVKGVNLLIPRKFHWVWLGPRPLPADYQRWMESWLRMHPGWDGYLWTDANRPSLRNEDCFLAATSMAQRADILRYEIIFDNGGIYVDTDFENRRNIESVLDNVDAFIAEEEPGRVAIGIFGARPNHPWLQDVMECLPSAFRTESYITRQTGPDFMERVMAEREDVHRFGPRLFYPYSWREPERGNDAFPDAYAVHHWAHSWAADAQEQLDALQKPLRVELEAVIPPGERFLFVSENISVRLAGNRAPIPFRGLPKLDWGNPSCDEDAIIALQEARRIGLKYIAFEEHTRWWFQYYRGFYQHLKDESECTIRGKHVTVFRLSDL